MRVVVTGGREFCDADFMNGVMDFLVTEHGITEIAHGAQQTWMPLTQRWRGADHYAGEWARARHMPCTEYPVSEAEWRALHKAAGPIRNRRMLDEFQPDLVVAFPGNKGTADCVKAALERNIRVLAVDKEGDEITMQLLGPDRLF